VFLRQALVNIIHNAVKHSPVGGAILVDVPPDPAGGVQLEVPDSGPEHSERIFDRFFRADECRSSVGAGPGFSIAQLAVRVHGGTIKLLTAPGTGCTFQISLPQHVSS
jgi:two-component system OmpR family sensor kinase